LGPKSTKHACHIAHMVIISIISNINNIATATQHSPNYELHEISDHIFLLQRLMR
jgi:hypothetical protein